MIGVGKPGAACVCVMAFCLSVPISVEGHELTDTVPSPAGGPPSRVTFLDVGIGLFEEHRIENGRPIGRLGTFRHVMDDRDADLPLADTWIVSADARSITVDGERRLVILFELATEYAGAESLSLLAVLDERLTLGDVVAVGVDRHTGFAESAVLPIGRQDEAVVIYGTHANSNQSYRTDLLIMVSDRRLDLIDSMFTFGTWTCQTEESQSLHMRTVVEDTRFWPIIATVRDRRRPNPEPCDAVETTTSIPVERDIAVTYRWDGTKRRYVADSDAFDLLRQEAESRF